ncbi:MAG TPA: DoxX family protein, partial [Saliniramus sp.]|nr:DoxX family protein [Saliniramus sp.]
MNTLEARDTRPAGMSIPGLVATSIAMMERLPHSLVALTARIFPAAVFWQSGRTKVDGFALKDSTFFLFEYE